MLWSARVDATPAWVVQLRHEALAFSTIRHRHPRFVLEAGGALCLHLLTAAHPARVDDVVGCVEELLRILRAEAGCQSLGIIRHWIHRGSLQCACWHGRAATNQQLETAFFQTQRSSNLQTQAGAGHCRRRHEIGPLNGKTTRKQNIYQQPAGAGHCRRRRDWLIRCNKGSTKFSCCKILLLNPMCSSMHCGPCPQRLARARPPDTQARLPAPRSWQAGLRQPSSA